MGDVIYLFLIAVLIICFLFTTNRVFYWYNVSETIRSSRDSMKKDHESFANEYYVKVKEQAAKIQFLEEENALLRKYKR